MSSEKMDEVPPSLAVPPVDRDAVSSTYSDVGIMEEKKRRQGSDAERSREPSLERVVSPEYPQSWKLATILLALVLTIFLVSLDMTIVATAIPRITDEFKSLDQVGWYGSAFFLTVASFQSTWGKAYKYFPLKIGFLVAVGIFELGSLICAVAQNSTTLIIGRAVAGVGGAGIGSGVYTIIAFSAPPNRRPALTGIIGIVYAVSSVIGPLLGGVFTDDLSWRWCFYINLPVGGASVALIILFFQTPKKAKPVEATLREKFLQMDFLGTFVLMASIVCLVLALQWGGVSKSWGSADVIGVLVEFGLILVLFAGIEIWLGERALIVPRILKQRTIALIISFQFFNAAVFFLLTYYLPIYFQVVSGVSAAQSGVRNLPFVLGVSLFTILAGVIITITGHYIPLLVLGSILSTIGTGLTYTLDIGSPSSEWIGYQALCGIGQGIGIQIPIIVAQAVVDSSDIASATAIVIFFQTLTGAIFVSIGQSLFANKLIQTIPKYVPDINPKLVVATGATELRKTFAAAQIPGIVKSYMAGLQDAYILGIALAGMAVLISFLIVGLDRRTLKDKKGSSAGGV